MKNPIICALDTSNNDQAISWIKSISEHGGMVKIGLELFTNHFYGTINAAQLNNVDIFLDLKFYDIPSTINKAIKPFVGYNKIKMMTIHGSGDSEMIKSAVNAAEHIEIIAVTLLTSIKEQNSIDIVSRITEKSLNAGAAGIVCSAKEVKHLRQTFGNDFKIIVPGVRPSWYIDDNDDQSRTGTPRDIINDGANYLVIGRPITTASNFINALQKIMLEL